MYLPDSSLWQPFLHTNYGHRVSESGFIGTERGPFEYFNPVQAVNGGLHDKCVHIPRHTAFNIIIVCNTVTEWY